MNQYIKQIQELSHPNKYTKWYCSIIQHALVRNQQGDVVQGEKHHIVPRSVDNGSINDTNNVVLLTYREHFIAHLLLRKMLVNGQYRRKMDNAVVRLCCGLLRGTRTPTNQYASRRFSIVRTAIYNSGIYSRTKDTMWVNNGTKSKRIVETELTTYINNGWEIGRHSFTRKKHICVNKDGVTKNIDPLHKNQYLLDGWALGQAPSSKICVTNGIKNIHVDPNNIPDGYMIGSCQKTQSGRKWVTNGVIDVYLKAVQDVPEGWTEGRSNKKLTVNKSSNTGKIRINDGTTQKYHPEKDPIPSGWVRGGLSPKKKWTWGNKSA